MGNYKEKESVTLRQKPMNNGGASLYLDYSIDGVRYREFLHMYLSDGKTKLGKLQNQETMKLAQAMKAKRILDIQNNRAGFQKKVKDVEFSAFLAQQAEAYFAEGKDEYAKTVMKINSWVKAYNKRVNLRQVDKDYMLGFFDFIRTGKPGAKAEKTKNTSGRKIQLDKGLSDGTVYQYYQTLGTIFNNARRKGLINHNPLQDMDRGEKPHKPESEREFLTIDEVRRLIETPCSNDNVKRAFLFACFTGLRLSDIEKLTWGDIRGDSIEIRQEKTRRMVYIPLSENAASFLPERKGDGDRVFMLKNRTAVTVAIRQWVKDAGINKHITFHCSRHTYATLLLTYGADLYTVSKLLGHSDIGVTQVYAKIIDRKKQEAVNLIPKL